MLKAKIISSPQTKLKKNIWKINDLEQNSILNVSKYQKKNSDRLDRYDRKFYSRKKKLREEPNVGEKVLILAERLKKKSSLGKFYKQTV